MWRFRRPSMRRGTEVPDPSTDPVGTVRREEHEDGYSIWQRVGTCRSVWDNTDSRYVSEPSSVWRCVHSTSAGNLGAHLMGYQISGEWAVIGAVPGTPADQRGDEVTMQGRLTELDRERIELMLQIAAVQRADAALAALRGAEK